MDDTIQKLLDVQDKDERIANLQKMIDSVPEEKERISQELAGAEAQAEEAKLGLQKVQSKINDIESDIQAAHARIADLNTKSTTVKKNDEYRAILDQIEAIKKQISDFEDNQLELMDEVEEAKGACDEAAKVKDAADKRIKAAQADLDVRAQNCQAQIEKIKSDRDELAGSIGDDQMRFYNRLIAQQKPGMPFRKAIVPIEDNCCGACFLAIPPDKRNKVQAGHDVVTCGQCGAILYVE